MQLSVFSKLTLLLMLALSSKAGATKNELVVHAQKNILISHDDKELIQHIEELLSLAHDNLEIEALIHDTDWISSLVDPLIISGKLGSVNKIFRIIAQIGWVDALRVLLTKEGANIHATNTHGATALFLAVQAGHLPAVEFLLNRGAKADIDKKALGYTPLYMTIKEEHLAVAQCLLQSGASPDLPVIGGYTPLHTAAAYNRFDHAQLLLGYAANVFAKTEKGETAYAIALEKGCTEIADLLAATMQQQEALNKAAHPKQQCCCF